VLFLCAARRLGARSETAYVAPMLKLVQFKPIFGLPNPSPFCFKVENYLRMAGIPFEAKVGDPRKAPKKKLPYIVEDDGRVISDSEHIVRHLEKKHGDKLDGGMTAEERAQARAVRRMVEEGFYFNLVYMRWGDDAGFAIAESEILRPAIPALLRPLVIPAIRKQIKGQLFAQGTGRHAQDDIYRSGGEDLDALSTLLGDKTFFFGETPRTIDATLYAFLGVALGSPPDNPLKEQLRAKKNLVAYCERMKSKYYAAAA
jgi:glutathione S-transferase